MKNNVLGSVQRIGGMIAMVFLGLQALGCLILGIAAKFIGVVSETLEDKKMFLSALLTTEILFMLVTAVPFIVWFYAAARFREKQLGRSLSLAPWWAIGGWFIPIANLIYPYRLAEAISTPAPELKGTTPLIGAWWLTFILPILAMRVQSKMSMEVLQTATLIEFAMLSISAVLAIYVIRYINNQHLQFAQQNNPSTPDQTGLATFS